MDIRLFEAARNGDIKILQQLLAENPIILHTIALFSTENPLHIASVAGHADFVKEIVKRKPELARQINQDGFSPLHVAAANGHVEIVRELVKVDRNLCRLEGRDKRTPLHYAAMTGRIDAITEMVLACSECVEDVTVQGGTALHLAVKYCQFEVIRILVDSIIQMKKEDVLNVRDVQGNTVLHLAVWKKQRQASTITITSSSSLEVNAINQSGLTALDVLLMFPSEAGDREIQEILQGAGAIRARGINIAVSPISSESQNQTLLNHRMTPETSQPTSRDVLEYFKFKRGRDSPSEARSSLLVIAVLVATATYQVGFNPPGGVWQDNYAPDTNNSTSTSNIINKSHIAGRSILGTNDASAFNLYMIFNSMGFYMSLFMISILTHNFPFYLELLICLIAMYVTYSTAVVNIAPDDWRVFYTVFNSVVPSTIHIVEMCVRRCMNKLKKLVVGVIHRVNSVEG